MTFNFNSLLKTVCNNNPWLKTFIMGLIMFYSESNHDPFKSTIHASVYFSTILSSNITINKTYLYVIRIYHDDK